jgi:hypothetical protein
MRDAFNRQGAYLSSMSENPARNSQKRWFAQSFRLADAPGDDLSASTTAAERFEMVAILTARMMELTDSVAPTYSRNTIPVRVVRRGE